MAILIPDVPRDCSFGERQVFDRLETDLKDQPDWIAIHSLGLAKHAKKLWGEADFVLLTTKGIFVVEVKGGKVSCRDGHWMYEAMGKTPYEGSHPWTQAKDAMFALRNRIVEVAPHLKRLLYGFGVVMPHEVFTATGAEIEPDVLLDKRDFRRNLGFFIGDLNRHWEREYQLRHGTTPELPNVANLREIRKILRPDVFSTLSLGSWLNGLDAELLQLTNAQIRASRRMAANERTIVRGRAGTGKTVLAVERARQLAQQGKSVLYLCFNQLLAEHVRNGLGTCAGVAVQHLHALYRRAIDSAGLGGKLGEATSDAELYGRQFPELFAEAVLAHGHETYDVLIVDEAQDLLTGENLDALDLLVDGGLRRGRWHLFLDPLQNIYGKLSESAEQRLAELSIAYDDLFENCRNTRRVAIQASIMSGIDMAIDGGPEGLPCDAVYYTDTKDFAKKLGEKVRELLASEVGPDRMIILSTRRLENSPVTECAGLVVRDVREKSLSGTAPFCTMHAFKGLERDVVLAVDLERLSDPQLSLLLYAGLSRARLLLVPFVPESAREAYGRLAAEFGVRLRTNSR